MIMYYSIDETGDVIACGITAEFGYPAEGNEPFDVSTAFNWRKDVATNDWISTVIDYQYIIIPSELIPSLTELAALVADIDVQNQFNVILSTTEITTREGITHKVPSDIVNMTPCKILKWKKGDDALLQGIIDVWNSQGDSRIIDFECKFDNLAYLDAFKVSKR